ncbi:MAG: hypothetical protein KGL90_06625 [Burkholderiales bacterium]|nr:hypothetical protein [Burkholderiales bacterium]
MFASDQRLRVWTRAVLVLACVAGCATGASAQSNDREQEQLKRLKLQMRQVQQEKAALEEAQSKTAQENSSLAQALKSAQSEANGQKAAARKLGGLKVEVAALQQERAALTEQVALLQKQLDESKAEAHAQQGKAQTGAVALSELTSKHQALAQKQEVCRQDNATLLALGHELLTRYDNKGFGDVLGAKEPFFQLARVTLENHSAEYRNKLDAARVNP